jgi:Tol biopolymer transport system component
MKSTQQTGPIATRLKLARRGQACFLLLLTLLPLTPAKAATPQLKIAQLTNSNCPSGSFYPSLDSTAKKVAFTSFCDLVPGGNTDGNSELYFMNTTGTGLVQLTHTNGGVGIVQPYLAANGQTIVFASDRDLVSGSNADGNYEIFTISTSGTNLKQLTNTVGGRGDLGYPGNTGPCFDPKAQKIVFTSDRDLISGHNSDGNNDMFLMNADGTGLMQLTSTLGGFGVGSGCLNATDTQVVFDSDRDLVPSHNTDGNYEIFSMAVNGSGVVQLTNTTSPPSGVGNVTARWASNGKTVFFRSDVDLTGNNPDANQEAFRMNADGTGLVQLTCTVGGFGSTIWAVTPNGKTLAIESDADLVPGNNLDRNGEIYTMKITN